MLIDCLKKWIFSKLFENFVIKKKNEQIKELSNLYLKNSNDKKLFISSMMPSTSKLERFCPWSTFSS